MGRWGLLLKEGSTIQYMVEIILGSAGSRRSRVHKKFIRQTTPFRTRKGSTTSSFLDERRGLDVDGDIGTLDGGTFMDFEKESSDFWVRSKRLHYDDHIGTDSTQTGELSGDIVGRAIIVYERRQ